MPMSPARPQTRRLLFSTSQIVVLRLFKFLASMYVIQHIILGVWRYNDDSKYPYNDEEGWMNQGTHKDEEVVLSFRNSHRPFPMWQEAFASRRRTRRRRRNRQDDVFVRKHLQGGEEAGSGGAGLLKSMTTSTTNHRPVLEDQEALARSPPASDKNNKNSNSNNQKSALDDSIIIPKVSGNSTPPNAHEQELVRIFLRQMAGRSMLPLAAVLETPLRQSDNNNNSRHNVTKTALPIRQDVQLTTVSYPRHIQSCHDIPNHWPVGHTPLWDTAYGSNVGRTMRSIYPFRYQYAKTTCPVDADPFLPWIHDVFVMMEDVVTGVETAATTTTSSSSSLQIVAHNKRRCQRDPKDYQNDIENLEPQVALMQSVPIQRLDYDHYDEHSVTTTHKNHSNTWERLYSQLPPSWKPGSKGSTSGTGAERSENEHWYRLVPLEDADPHSQETRFLCQFFTLRPVMSSSATSPQVVQGVEKVIVGETWSTFPYNYEHANFQHRRGQQAQPMLTRPVDDMDSNGIHNEQVWNAMLHVKCPLPQVVDEHIRQQLLSESSTPPSFYMDLVPVRTPPRETLTGYSLPLIKLGHPVGFDPVTEWGDAHVLPPVSHSGRWANIPICPSSISALSSKKVVDNKLQERNSKNNNTYTDPHQAGSTQKTNKPHYLVGCIWASAVFSERGKTAWDSHTSERLLEWLTYHLNIAGFDHMVVYDNTEAFTNETSLESVTSLFPGQVTRQPWKHRICNNNGYGSQNAGERSSQYAAEASCRARYGPTTEWMAFFDTDEYFIPSGNWSSIREMLEAGVADGRIEPATNILSFYETKAFLNYRFTEHYTDESRDCPPTCKACDCRKKRDDATYLEAFCEPLPFPRIFPETKAKMKQIYRPSFVLNHFVHYAAVTDLVNTRPKFPRVVGYPIERRAKEFTEGYMLHTKTRLPHASRDWNSTNTCRETPAKCSIGIPYPYYQGSGDAINGTFAKLPVDSNGQQLNEFGIPFNCYELRKIQEELAIRLHQYLDPLKEKWQNSVHAAKIQAGMRDSDSLLSGENLENRRHGKALLASLPTGKKNKDDSDDTLP